MPIRIREMAFSSAASEKLAYDRKIGVASLHVDPAGSVKLHTLKG